MGNDTHLWEEKTTNNLEMRRPHTGNVRSSELRELRGGWGDERSLQGGKGELKKETWMLCKRGHQIPQLSVH